MSEIFALSFRNQEKDYEEMSTILMHQGWQRVDATVNKLVFSSLPILNKAHTLQPNSGILFEADKDTNRLIRTSLASGQLAYIGTPYLFLANKSIRFGLTQLVAGTAIGVVKYE